MISRIVLAAAVVMGGAAVAGASVNSEGLDELKGAAMKMGQMLSMFDDGDLLPKGWGEALSQLQSSATPRPWKEILPLLEQALPGLDAFDHIDEEAVHSASIGQVHRGWLKNGQAVAVKVRYPYMEEFIASDITMMKRAFMVAKVLPASKGLDDIADTVEALFLQELDFAKEREYYEFYYQHFRDYSDYRVPQVIPEACTPTVLTTEWIDGENLIQWINRHEHLDDPVTQEKRNALGQKIFELMFIEMFKLHRIQSDPNPANFLVTPDEKLVLLDFGATEVLSDSLVEHYRNLCQTLMDGTPDEIEAVCMQMGMILEEDKPAAKEAFREMMALIARPFWQENFRWKDHRLAKEAYDAGRRFSLATHLRPPPANIVFLNRRATGNELILERLGPILTPKNFLPALLKLGL